MKIGDVIKNRRKDMELTQEELAKRLGVTAPAVNKWEKGNALPDVALLAPIARLLGITTDELLSFSSELTDEEIARFISKLAADLAKTEKNFREIFLAAKKKIEEHPNCYSLIWQSAALLDARMRESELRDNGSCEAQIFSWYERCLSSDDERVRQQAADLLFHAFFRKGDYERANRCLEYFSLNDPERKRKGALVNSKTGKREAAYRAYEELILTGYQHMQSTLNALRILYMEDGEREMPQKLVDISSSAASIFEMGRYHEACAGLDLAVREKDVERTAQLMRDLLESIETIGDFAKSALYRHVALKEVSPDFTGDLKSALLKSLDDESFSYMRGYELWETLKSGGPRRKGPSRPAGGPRRS